MNATRVFIIHGWEGNPRIHWLGWLADQFKEIGVEVIAPAFPSPNHPICAEWIKAIQKTVGLPTENDFFVGHSLGPIAIMNYLQSLPGNMKIGGAVFVAGFAKSLGIKETETFFEKSIDLKSLKNKSRHGFVDIYSNNDPYVPVDRAEQLRDELGARLILLEGSGHINTAAGYTQLPQALEQLKSWMKP